MTTATGAPEGQAPLLVKLNSKGFEMVQISPSNKQSPPSKTQKDQKNKEAKKAKKAAEGNETQRPQDPREKTCQGLKKAGRPFGNTTKNGSKGCEFCGHYLGRRVDQRQDAI